MEINNTFTNRWILILAVLLTPIPNQSFAQEISDKYSLDKNVTIKGTLSIERKYGPPNYGENPETDRIEMITVLNLSTPITVFRDKKATIVYVKNQSSIHMGIKKELRRFSLKSGICLQVSGELYEAFSGHHHYPIVMTVTQIEKC